MIERAEIQRILIGLAAQRPADFVGLGVIVYRSIVDLPVVPLGSRLNIDIKLPISGASNVMKTLASLATRGSSMHDGFHLINACSGDLTHIAQFVSPPLDFALANPLAIWPTGARQMTALLISSLPQVEFAAVVSATGGVQLYENGMEGKSGADQ